MNNKKKQKIGARIRKERKTFFKSQGEFAQALGLHESSRQSVGNWEKGKILPDLETLDKMCELFQCKPGYLLCEYDCKTKELTDINKATGLSPKSISKLKSMNGPGYSEILTTLNRIIEHDYFFDLIKDIHVHVFDFNDSNLKLDTNAETIVANVMNCQGQNVKNYLRVSSESLIKDNFMKIIKSLSSGISPKSKKKENSF